VELLRERGLSKAGKRAGRETSEGAVGFSVSGGAAGLIELGCETDFVAKTDDFQKLANDIATLVASDDSLVEVEKVLAAKADGGTVEELIQQTVARVGENVQLKRVARVQGGVAGGYVHMGGKLGVVVALETEASGDAVETLAKDLSMHVAAVDPTPVAIDRDGVDAALIENERRILTNQALQSGKPEKVVEKIVDGRLNKFYAENCLVEQGFVKDPDTTVAKLVEQVAGDSGGAIAVAGFARFKLGEANPE